MPHYIAMLRGINVSGHKPIKMDALRASFESLGFSDVKKKPAPDGAVEILKKLGTAGEQIWVIGREVYLQCPNGYGNTKVSNTAVEKKLGVPATTRNWRTVNALLELARF
jgi:uncharacterized protein (DUF1697 family)